MTNPGYSNQPHRISNPVRHAGKALANIHPFLFAVFPILALRNHNIIYVDLGSIVRPLILSITITGALWLLLRMITRNRDKSGLMTSLAAILFFSYGHIYLLIESSMGKAVSHRYLLGAFAVVFVLVSGMVLRARDVSAIKQFLTVVGSTMIAFAVAQSASYDIQTYQANAQVRAKLTQIAQPTDTRNGQALPDIYLIILDAHTRSDVLRDKYKYDNSYFVKGLTDLGFYVAECSQSNYSRTRYSLPSLLNTDYLQNFTDMNTMPSLEQSTVVQDLRSMGYVTIEFANRASGHFRLNADIHLSRNKLALGVDFEGGPSEFETQLIQTSLLKLFYDIPQLIPGFNPVVREKAEWREHYLQTYYILDELKRIPGIPGSKFVYAHIMAPHPPYIFTPSGEFKLNENEMAGYRDNVDFIDHQILRTAKAILENSSAPPVIIIQGDHGPLGKSSNPERRMTILNAYYVDREARKSLYSHITPVNSFRVIFNHYFGTNFPLLEDISYYGNSAAEFSPERIIPNTCQD